MVGQQNQQAAGQSTSHNKNQAQPLLDDMASHSTGHNPSTAPTRNGSYHHPIASSTGSTTGPSNGSTNANALQVPVAAISQQQQQQGNTAPHATVAAGISTTILPASANRPVNLPYFMDAAAANAYRLSIDPYKPLSIPGDDFATHGDEEWRASVRRMIQAFDHPGDDPKPEWLEPKRDGYTISQGKAFKNGQKIVQGDNGYAIASASASILLEELAAIHRRGVLTSDFNLKQKTWLVDKTSKYSVRLEKVIRAIEGNKLVAVDVLTGERVGDLTMRPDLAVQRKEENIKGNFKKKGQIAKGRQVLKDEEEVGESEAEAEEDEDERLMPRREAEASAGTVTSMGPPRFHGATHVGPQKQPAPSLTRDIHTRNSVVANAHNGVSAPRARDVQYGAETGIPGSFGPVFDRFVPLEVTGLLNTAVTSQSAPGHGRKRRSTEADFASIENPVPPKRSRPGARQPMSNPSIVSNQAATPAPHTKGLARARVGIGANTDNSTSEPQIDMGHNTSFMSTVLEPLGSTQSSNYQLFSRFNAGSKESSHEPRTTTSHKAYAGYNQSTMGDVWPGAHSSISAAAPSSLSSNRTFDDYFTQDQTSAGQQFTGFSSDAGIDPTASEGTPNTWRAGNSAPYPATGFLGMSVPSNQQHFVKSEMIDQPMNPYGQAQSSLHAVPGATAGYFNSYENYVNHGVSGAARGFANENGVQDGMGSTSGGNEGAEPINPWANPTYTTRGIDDSQWDEWQPTMPGR